MVLMIQPSRQIKSLLLVLLLQHSAAFQSTLELQNLLPEELGSKQISVSDELNETHLYSPPLALTTHIAFFTFVLKMK